MSSRAALLLIRENDHLQDNPIKGVRTYFVRNNPLEWEVIITGPENTPWDGGLFKLYLSFDENYDETPPTVGFLTVPFHPNVDMQTGHPHIPILDDPITCWRPLDGTRHLLSTLRILLAEPLVNYPPANVPASKCWIERPKFYDQLTRDSVIASRRLAAGLPLHENQDSEDVNHRNSNGKSNSNVIDDRGGTPTPQELGYDGDVTLIRCNEAAKINFEDYHANWRSLATSAPLEKSVAGNLLINHKSTPKMTLDQINALMQRQHDVLYGRFPAVHLKKDPYGRPPDQRKMKSILAEKRCRKLQGSRVNTLRRIYNLANLDGTEAPPQDEIIDNANFIHIPSSAATPYATEEAEIAKNDLAEDAERSGDASVGTTQPSDRLETFASGTGEWALEKELDRRLHGGWSKLQPRYAPEQSGLRMDQRTPLSDVGLEKWEEDEANDLMQWSSELDIANVAEVSAG